MLYDPKWEVKTTTDPLSLESLIAWLEKQPADKDYDWNDMQTCMLGQWLSTLYLSVEFPARNLDPYKYVLNGSCTNLDHFDDIASMEPHTFGAALGRAYEMQHFGQVQPAL
jgi:predicted metalloendopeptidase